MKKLLLIFVILSCSIYAFDIKGNFSTGVHMGTPYWNSANLEEGKEVDTSSSYMRVINRLQLNGKMTDNLSFGLNAIRSDGFESDNRLSRTRFQRLYVGYDFKSGNFRVGRIMPFNKWLMGSLDGASISYQITDMFKVHVVGGLNARYGELYDNEDNYFIGYGDVSIKTKNIGGKLKFYNNEDRSKTGFEVNGRLNKLRWAANFGYDITNERVADGGLNLSYIVNRDFTVSGNYGLYRSEDWKLIRIQFDGYLLERFVVGCNYKVFEGYSIDFRQLVSLTSERTNYVSYLTVQGKYFHVGANYLNGDSDYQRMGFTVGGHYSPLQDLELIAGVSPVDHVFHENEEHEFSTSVYFRINYKVLEYLSARANFNYYNNNATLNKSIRGGLNLIYYFGN